MQNMNHSIKYFAFLLILIIVLSSCSILPIVSDKEKEDTQKIQRDESTEKKQKTDSSAIKLLLNEADYRISEKQYNKAMSIYNYLLSKTKEHQKTAIIKKIEKTLTEIPSEVLQQWLNRVDTHIPRPLILYSIGLRLTLENNPNAAKQTIEDFLAGYPNHYLHKKALDLLETIKKNVFVRHTLGCLLPLSGKYSILGQRALTGIQLAMDELSSKYSVEFKLIFADTKGETETAIEGLKKLYQQNVIGILGPFSAMYEVSQEAENLKIPMIALTQRHDFALQGEYVFTNFITPEMQIQALGNYLFSKLGNTRAVILYPDERYGSVYMELFKAMAAEYKVNILAIKAYDGSEKDFSGVITGLKKDLETWYFTHGNKSDTLEIDGKREHVKTSRKTTIHSEKLTDKKKSKSAGSVQEEEDIVVDCQVIFIPDLPSRLNLILSQLTFNDIEAKYLAGTNLWHDKSLIRDSKGYLRIAVIPDGFFDKSTQYPETQVFAEKYKATFDSEPQFIEAIAYDTAKILLSTAMDETVKSREDLKNALKGKRIYNGATGPTMFDEKGLVHRPLFLLTIENDDFVEIK